MFHCTPGVLYITVLITFYSASSGSSRVCYGLGLDFTVINLSVRGLLKPNDLKTVT